MKTGFHWLRRLVLAPGVVLLTVLLVTTIPVWVLAAAFLSPLVQGRLRPLRLLWLVVLHLVMESLMLVELLGLWIASGFGWKLRSPYFERIHYDIVGTYLRLFFREAKRVLNLSVEVHGPAPDAFPGEPLLVCSRHAGPGDSLIVGHALVNWYKREPRVVLKDTLAWDPAVDVILNRLPSRFISPSPGASDRVMHQIAELATDLDENDAFVIFPEGGNFTPRRRQRAIDRLRRAGHDTMAARAEAMTHVLAPRPGGVLAAMEAAPEADILMVAHTGLDHMLTVADVWRELPMDKAIVMQWWRVSRAEIPEDREAQIDWLFSWWEHIDDWIAARR
ncbi:MAG: 1-acyl-sn-glycerol-3-phosphate acyltransferase [Nocardioidaceae bacterium]